MSYTRKEKKNSITFYRQTLNGAIMIISQLLGFFV